MCDVELDVVLFWCSSKEVGKQLRMTFTVMKGGARSVLDGIDYDEGWCVI